MQIANMLGTSTVDALEASYGKRKKREAREAGIGHQGEDSVTISETARLLYDLFVNKLKTEQKEEQREAAGQDSTSRPSIGKNLEAAEEDSKKNPEKTKANTESFASENTKGSFEPQNAASRLEALNKKIEAIQKKIVAVQNSNLPPEVKEAEITSLMGQIGQLMQEVNALKQEAAPNPAA